MEPLGDVDGDGVAGLFADGSLQVGCDWEFVGAVAERHERAFERLVVDRASDLDQSAGYAPPVSTT